MRMAVLASIVAMIIGLAATPAAAQFAGDVFFAQPSVVVESGQEVSLDIVLFGGSDVVGAADYQVAYNATQLQFVGVALGSDGLRAVALDNGDNVGIVTLNDVALDLPIGTVSLAKVRFRAIAAPGTRSNVQLRVRRLLKANETAFSQQRGFSGEVVVTGGAMALQNESSNVADSVETVTASSQLGRRALAVRRPGQVVELRDPTPRRVLVRQGGGE